MVSSLLFGAAERRYRDAAVTQTMKDTITCVSKSHHRAVAPARNTVSRFTTSSKLNCKKSVEQQRYVPLLQENVANQEMMIGVTQ